MMTTVSCGFYSGKKNYFLRIGKVLDGGFMFLRTEFMEEKASILMLFSLRRKC
jgi:hypothetical protein